MWKSPPAASPPRAPTCNYDAENRLTAINGGEANPEYTYNADGQRARKKVAGVSREFVYDLAGNVVAEFVGPTWTKGYVHLGGQMLAQYDNTVTPATTFFAHTDHLGSTRLLTKVNQAVQECEDYYPFGELETTTCTPNPGTATTSHKFTGKERDTESGLDNFLARYMASNQGRFFSPDPGNASGFTNLDDPQGWNGYAYVRNSPLLFIDPLGMVYCRPAIPASGSQIGTNSVEWICDRTDKECDQDPSRCKGYTKFDSNLGEKQNKVEPDDKLNDFALSALGGVGQMPILEFSGAVIAASMVVGATGGTACYFFCGTSVTTLGMGTAGSTILRNLAAGQIIRWGLGQAGAEATRQLTQHLTRQAVKQMIANGLNKATVQHLLNQYGAALAAGGAELANTQLQARYELMKKILELWPDK